MERDFFFTVVKDIWLNPIQSIGKREKQWFKNLFAINIAENWKFLRIRSALSFCKRKGIIILSCVCVSGKGGIITTLEEKISV